MEKIISTHLSNQNIVDREVETEFILNIIQNKKTDLLILYSQSGIGKSTLSNKLANLIPEHIPICVRTNPENESKLQPEGSYLEKSFNHFVNFFNLSRKKYRKLCFDYYISHNKNISIKREALERIFSSVSSENIALSTRTSIGKYIASKLFKLYEYNSLNRLHLATKESMLIAHEYIKYILKNLNICLVIDNLQNIDYYSQQLITEWITTSERKAFFLFEYTLCSADRTDELIKFATYFQNLNLSVELLSLNALDVDNAVSAIKKAHPEAEKNIRFFEDVKTYYISQSNGNMQKLFDFSLKYTANSMLQKSYDPTYEKLNLVETNGKYILSIIIMHGGEIETSLLRHIVELSIHPPVFDYEIQIFKLQQYDLIEEKNNYYSLKHATLIDSWNNHQESLNRFNLLSYKNCCIYYNRILENKYCVREDIEKALLFLLKVYSQYEPEKIIPIVSMMHTMVSECIRPEQIFEYFLLFLEYIKGKEMNYHKALYQMMYFCFNYGLFKNCLYIIQLLERISSEKGKFTLFVYKINCIEYLELHDEAISLCEEYIGQQDSYRQIYICYLLLMGCYRSVNQMDKVLFYVDKIKSMPDYTKNYEYGIFLRLSEIYMSRTSAIPDVKKSVLFYEGKNHLLEVKSRITYSFLLAVTDNLDEAEKQLNLCIIADKSTHYWDSVLCLNKASILMLRKKFDDEVVFLLKKAELATNSSFDLLLILTLQMINYYEIERTVLNDYLLTRITRLLSHESDKHLIALVAYDLYLYYSKIKVDELAEKYYTIAKKTCEYNKTVEHHLYHTKNPDTPNLFTIDWCIGFTFFWNVDYEDTLE